jgi:hypothetical protein
MVESYRAISSNLSKVDDGVHRHEKLSERLTSLQAMSPATVRKDAAPSPDFRRYKI